VAEGDRFLRSGHLRQYHLWCVIGVASLTGCEQGHSAEAGGLAAGGKARLPLESQEHPIWTPPADDR